MKDIDDRILVVWAKLDHLSPSERESFRAVWDAAFAKGTSIDYPDADLCAKVGRVRRPRDAADGLPLHHTARR